jgi:hypothetical protein
MYELVKRLKWWHRAFWDWNIPIKIKLFCWFLLENKVLTWDNLLKKGGLGLGICILCLQGGEFVYHLMVQCSFVQLVWKEVLSHLKLRFDWNLQQLDSCFRVWIVITPKVLTCFICWQMWLHMNAMIFEGVKVFVRVVCFQVLALLEEFQVVKGSKARQNNPPSFLMDIPTRWFDGLSQHWNSKCGVGGVIKLNGSIIYHWRFNCGVDMNTRGELLGVWALLLMAIRLNIYHLQVVGDLKTIIEWLNHQREIQVTGFLCWKKRIRHLIS